MSTLRSIIATLLTIGILAAVPFVLFRLVRFYFDVIESYKKRTRYLVRYFGGREAGDGISVIYYERDKELHFFSDRDENMFYVPDERLWDQTMPDIFRGRQPLIARRIMRQIPKRVSVNFVATYPSDRSILYVDQSKTGSEKVLNIGSGA